VVINVPWYLEEPLPEQGLEPEEIAATVGSKPAARVDNREAGGRKPDSRGSE
jgi:hypothetical protein